MGRTEFEEIWSEEIINPRGATSPILSRLAKRLTSLNGATIGLYDNLKPGANIILESVQELLKTQYQISKFAYVSNKMSNPISPDQLRTLKETDAVLIASAD